MSTLVLALLGFVLGGGLPEHPRLLLNQSELDFLKSHQSDPAYAEAFTIAREQADGAGGPAVDRPYDWNDVDELYAGPLFVDSRNVFYLGLQYRISPQQKYVDKAAAILRADMSYIDVTYRDLNWWDSIKMNIMGIRILYAVDFLFDALAPSDRNALESWLRTYAGTVQKLHEKDTNGQYYADHRAGNNIKSWDNATIGLAGYLFGDPALIDYALSSSANMAMKYGQAIELSYRTQIRRAIVDEWSGRNSRYGTFRTVDWWRSIEKGYEWVETVGYQAYHQQANELLTRAARLHGLDLHHVATRAETAHVRHHPVQPIERILWFLLLQADPADNEWHHWDGSKYYYTDGDRFEADKELLKLAGFMDLVQSPALAPGRARLATLVAGGLRSGNYSEAHILGFTWPLMRLHALDPPAEIGNLAGKIEFEKPASYLAEVSLLRGGDAFVDRYELPVEVNADGVYDALYLPATVHTLIARCQGFKSAGTIVSVSKDANTQVPPLTLEEGVHAIVPPSRDYLHRADLRTVDFEYFDPQGYAGLGLNLFVLVAAGPYQFIDLLGLAPDLFEVVQQDDQRMLLRLDLSGIALPDNAITLYFVGQQHANGAILCDQARYRFVR